MDKVLASGRLMLCLWICTQLVLPFRLWAETARSRDLVVEEIEEQKNSVALWVLTIGVSKYKDERINLKFAHNDAIQIARMLKTQEGVLFREVFTKALVNENATREKILQNMGDFLGQAAPEDMVLIFLAGHGLQDRKTGTYYFVPHNANGENLVYSGLPMPTFSEMVKRLRTHVNKVVLWLDSCHAGAMTVAARGVNVGEDLTEALAGASGEYVLSASMAGEESLEDEDFEFGNSKGHGAFTYSLLHGLNGAAADSTGVVWLSDLFGHVSREVPRLTHGRQHPHGSFEGTDLPLFVLDTGSTPSPGLAPAFVAVPQEKKGSKKWLWALLGAAVLGGGAAVGTGIIPPSEDTPKVAEIPLPPARPE